MGMDNIKVTDVPSDCSCRSVTTPVNDAKNDTQLFVLRIVLKRRGENDAENDAS